MTEQEAIRPEFLEQYRVMTNGHNFRVQVLEKRRTGRLWWKKEELVWVYLAVWGRPPSFEAAESWIRAYALADQRRYDEQAHGWQPVTSTGRM